LDTSTLIWHIADWRLVQFGQRVEKKGKQAKSASRERESLAGGISRLDISYIGALDERFRQRNQSGTHLFATPHRDQDLLANRVAPKIGH
jgi:hypothetical protein